MFSRPGVRFMLALTLASLLASFYLLLSPPEFETIDSVGADGYSKSAIGHAGLVQLLRDAGEPVVQLRHLVENGPIGLFVVAEPNELDADHAKALAATMKRSLASLLVLPKRAGVRDPAAPTWIGEEGLLAKADVVKAIAPLLGESAGLLDLLLGNAPSIVRVDEVTNWRSDEPGLRGTPVLSAPLQLLPAADDLEAMLQCDQGVLLGRRNGIYLLSDPDLIANHGLHRGDNAALVLAILRCMQPGGTVVFDETCHGHRREPSIWTQAGHFPMVLMPVQLLLLFALTLWIAAGRFGVPRPPPPAIEAGKAFLIDNTVALLARGGRNVPMLQRYLRQCVRRAADRLQAPANLDEAACRDWVLRRLPAARRQQLSTLLQQKTENLDPGAAMVLARQVHEITEEIAHVVS